MALHKESTLLGLSRSIIFYDNAPLKIIKQFVDDDWIGGGVVDGDADRHRYGGCVIGMCAIGVCVCRNKSGRPLGCVLVMASD